MLLLIWGLLVLGSVKSGYAAEEHPMIDCQWRVPLCQDFSTDRIDDDEGTVQFDDLPSYDLQVNAAVSLKRSDDGEISTMTVQLTDARTGEVSALKKYIVLKDQVVEGGVSFLASNGKRYAIACEGSRLDDGIPYGMMPCDPVKTTRHKKVARSRRKNRRLTHSVAQASRW